MRVVVDQHRNRLARHYSFEPQDIPIGPDATRSELARFEDKVVIGSNDRIVGAVLQALGKSGRQTNGPS
jgi:hypothetical protein